MKRKENERIILELEQKNAHCQEKLEQQAKELKITTIKLTKTERHILQLANLLSYADNDLEMTSQEKEILDKELSEIKVLKSSIENTLEDTLLPEPSNA